MNIDDAKRASDEVMIGDANEDVCEVKAATWQDRTRTVISRNAYGDRELCGVLTIQACPLFGGRTNSKKIKIPAEFVVPGWNHTQFELDHPHFNISDLNANYTEINTGPTSLLNVNNEWTAEVSNAPEPQSNASHGSNKRPGIPDLEEMEESKLGDIPGLKFNMQPSFKIKWAQY